MANQITIDIGAAANDGTGDPLRTAFNYVNNNFSNVWNTGLPTSNVQFLDNKILTVNTNANLVLAPNGIAKVVSNVSIVPNMSNVHSIGGIDSRWNTIYAQYLNISNDVTFGDLTVDGNLTVTGDIIEIGNIVTDAKTIQLANTASTANAANGSGITVGASDDIATLLYNSTSNTWNTNIGVSAVGNVSGTYILGNLAFANGLPATYGNANVAAYLPTYTGNLSAGNASVTNVVAAQNITAITGTFTGDQFSDGAMYVGSPAGTVLGSDVVIQITANSGSYSQTNFQNINPGVTASSDYILTADNGNDTTHYLDMGITSSGWDGSETNVLEGLVANNGYLYVQDGNLTLGTRAGNVSYSWNFDTTGNLSLPANLNLNSGNITQAQNENLYIRVSDDNDNGWSVFNVVDDGNVSNVLTRTRVSSTDFQINTDWQGTGHSWTFDNTGNLTAPGNIIFSDDYVYRGNTFTSPETNGVLKNFKWEFSDTVSGADTVTLQWNLLDTTFPQWYLTTNSQGNIYVFDGDAKTLGFLDNSINSGTVTFGTATNNGAGNSNDIELTTVTGNAYIRTGSNSWQFGDDGVLTVPGNIVMAAGSSLVGSGASPAPNISGFNSATFGANVTATGNISGGNLITGGRVVATGNIVTGGQIQSSAFTGGNISWSANSQVDFQGAIKVGGTGVIKGPGGASSITLNNNGANIPILGVTNTSNSTSTATGALIVSGGAGIAGNVYVGGNIVGNTAGYAIGYRDIPQVSFAGDTTIATTDAGKHYYSVLSTGNVLTIANNASQGFQVGAAITVVNQGSGTITIAQGSDVTLYMAGNATASNRTVSTFGMATIMKVATNTWFINGTGVS
jgi:uncharacterized protein YaiE (UPF0345 family)